VTFVVSCLLNLTWAGVIQFWHEESQTEQYQTEATLLLQ